MRRAAYDLAWGVLGVAVLLGLWHLASASGLVSRVFLPTPLATYDALIDGLGRGDLKTATGDTVLRMIQGWLVASAVGVAMGAVLGIWASARIYAEPVLEFVRPLPASAVIPVAIALFGLSPGMVIGVIAFGSLWPTLLATVHGFSAVEPRLDEVARALGLSRIGYIVKIGLPNAMPDILTGMRLSLTVALILAIVAEMLAGQSGLGTAMLLAARSFRSAEIFAAIVLLGAIGLVSNLALQGVERRLLRWRA